MAMLAYAARQREERLQAEAIAASAPEPHAVARQARQDARSAPGTHEPPASPSRPSRGPPGRQNGRVSMRAARQVATVLAEALAEGWIAVERAAELLKIRPQDVPAVAEGRAEMGPTAWTRLLEELKPWGVKLDALDLALALLAGMVRDASRSPHSACRPDPHHKDSSQRPEGCLRGPKAPDGPI
jgi:hypothetical protein